MHTRLAILTTLINPETIAAMVSAAAEAATQRHAKIVSITATVGCLDMPVIAQALFKKKTVDAVVVLGAVAQGETKHDELVVNTTTTAIVQLSLHYHKPVAFGIIGPGAHRQHFKPRAHDYAVRAVEAALRNLELLRELV